MPRADKGLASITADNQCSVSTCVHAYSVSYCRSKS